MAVAVVMVVTIIVVKTGLVGSKKEKGPVTIGAPVLQPASALLLDNPLADVQTGLSRRSWLSSTSRVDRISLD
jgi:hypothetical protein